MIFKALSLLALALAPLLFWQASSNAGLAAAASWNGFETVEVAKSLLQVDQEEGQLARVIVSDRAVQLARQGYAMEPLATEALFIVASSPEFVDAPARRQQLIDITVKLHLREKLMRALALEEAIKRGDLEEAFGHFDDLAALESEIVSPLIASLQPLLAEPEPRAAFAAQLRKKPGWANSFWKSVPVDDVQLSGYLELKDELAPKLEEETISRLVKVLIDKGRVEDALSMVRAESDLDLSSTAFLDRAAFAPIGWVLASSADAQMSKLSVGDGYAIFLSRGEATALASQIVTLTPGRYRLNASVQPRALESALSVKVECIDEAGRASERRDLGLGETFSVARRCRYHNLSIYGDAFDAPNDLSGEITSIAFERLRGL